MSTYIHRKPSVMTHEQVYDRNTIQNSQTCDDEAYEAYRQKLIDSLTLFYKEKGSPKIAMSSKLVNTYFPHRIDRLSKKLSTKYGEFPVELEAYEAYRQKLIDSLTLFYKEKGSPKIAMSSKLVNTYFPHRIDRLSKKLSTKYGESPLEAILQNMEN